MSIKKEICDETEQDFINVSEKCEAVLEYEEEDYMNENENEIENEHDNNYFDSNIDEEQNGTIKTEENLSNPKKKMSHTCEICMKTFSKPSHRRRHINTVHRCGSCA